MVQKLLDSSGNILHIESKVTCGLLCIPACDCVPDMFTKLSWYEKTRWKLFFVGFILVFGMWRPVIQCWGTQLPSVIPECGNVSTHGRVSYLISVYLNSHLSPSVYWQVPAKHNKFFLEAHTRLVTSDAHEWHICCSNTRQRKHVGNVEAIRTCNLYLLMKGGCWNSTANHFSYLNLPHSFSLYTVPVDHLTSLRVKTVKYFYHPAGTATYSCNLCKYTAR
jgi:hypothetical protein